jgi:DNA-directed RNA polymerase specialized sigma subunit
MKKLNDEQRKLIEDNYKLIRFLYRRSYTRVCSWEVFQGLGHEAICKAALGYDPSKGKFTTYFTWKIKQAIETLFSL